jgi:hypothetical protein
VAQVIGDEWGRGLIGSWNTAGWMQLPQRVGDKIGRLIGAGAGEVVAADSTSVNLYKVLAAALRLQAQRGLRPGPVGPRPCRRGPVARRLGPRPGTGCPCPYRHRQRTQQLSHRSLHRRVAGRAARLYPEAGRLAG